MTWWAGSCAGMSQTKPVVFDAQIKFTGKKLEGIEPTDSGVYELGHLAWSPELVKLSEA